MKHFKTFIYNLGGADSNVIQHNTFSVRVKYFLKAFSFTVSLPIVFFGWYELATIFTLSIWIKVGLPFLITYAIFHLDLSLLFSDSSRSHTMLRWGVALSNNILCVLFVLLNLNIDAVQKVNYDEHQKIIYKTDSTYHAEQVARYSNLVAMQTQRDEYDKKICVPQSLRKMAGLRYANGHKLCENRDSVIAMERTRLDTIEAKYYQIYQQEREQIATKNDVFDKLDTLLTEVLPQSVSKILTSILFAFFLLCLETSPLLLHLASRNDEYHQELAKFQANHKLKSDQRLKTMQDHNDKMAELKTEKQNNNDLTKWAEAKIASVLKKAPLNYKLNEYKRIFREQGMPELSDEIANVQNAISSGGDVDKIINHLMNKINQN